MGDIPGRGGGSFGSAALFLFTGSIMQALIPPDDEHPGPNPDDGNTGGRPTKLTPSIILATVQLLMEGNFRCVVARRIGINMATFRRWMANGKRYPDGLYARFRAAVLKAETEGESRAVAGILAAGFADDASHLEWFLERKYPQRWGRFRGELGDMKKRIADLEKLLSAEANVGADAEE